MHFRKMVGKNCYLSPVDVNDFEKFTDIDIATDELIGTIIFIWTYCMTSFTKNIMAQNEQR